MTDEIQLHNPPSMPSDQPAVFRPPYNRLVISASVQDYLKAIYEIREDTGKVSTNALAEKLGIAAASVTGMLKKLAESKLVIYEPYQGVTLSRAGEKMALEIIRHHRLLELYLHEAMGYELDRVHDEAERMEHAISEEFEDKMAALLGDPARDPHGDPIPTKTGQVASVSRLSLNEAATGKTVCVERVRDKDNAVLRQLGQMGLLPRVSVRVVDAAPADVLLISIEGREPVRLARALAKSVFVREK